MSLKPPLCSSLAPVFPVPPENKPHHEICGCPQARVSMPLCCLENSIKYHFMCYGKKAKTSHPIDTFCSFSVFNPRLCFWDLSTWMLGLGVIVQQASLSRLLICSPRGLTGPFQPLPSRPLCTQRGLWRVVFQGGVSETETRGRRGPGSILGWALVAEKGRRQVGRGKIREVIQFQEAPAKPKVASKMGRNPTLSCCELGWASGPSVLKGDLGSISQHSLLLCCYSPA